MKVTVTELPERLWLLEDNVQRNVPDMGVRVRGCVWGVAGTTTAWGKVDDFGSDWDYITGSDLVYSDESTPALVPSHIMHHLLLPCRSARQVNHHPHCRSVDAPTGFESGEGTCLMVEWIG